MWLAVGWVLVDCWGFCWGFLVFFRRAIFFFVGVLVGVFSFFLETDFFLVGVLVGFFNFGFLGDMTGYYIKGFLCFVML